MMKVLNTESKHTPCRSFKEVCEELDAEPFEVMRKIRAYPGKMEAVLKRSGKAYCSQVSYYRLADVKAFIRWARAN